MKSQKFNSISLYSFDVFHSIAVLVLIIRTIHPYSDKHGSFVRPQKLSFGMDATKAIEKLYGEGVYDGEEIVINEETSMEKTIEMVGFDKVALQQRLVLTTNLNSL